MVARRVAIEYDYVLVLVLHYRLLTPLGQAPAPGRRGAPREAEVVSIVVEGLHLDELRATAGQFFRWRFLTPDHWRNAHPFSLSALPTPTALRLTVKALRDGTWDLQGIPVGTWVLAAALRGPGPRVARRARAASATAPRGTLLTAGWEA